MKIELGHKPEETSAMPTPSEKKDPEIFYPSVYISDRDLDGEELSIDQEVTLKGIVKSVTSSERGGKKTYSCDIEVHSLEAADGKKTAKKGSSKDDEDAIEKGLSEQEEGEDDDDEEEEGEE